MAKPQDGPDNSGNEAFTRMWADFAAQAMKAGMAYSPDSTPPEAARQMRDAQFKAMSEYCDQFMRSPQFLGAMRYSLTNAIELRRQLNDFLARAQHEMQSASRQDIDQLMVAVQHVEDRMSGSLDRLSQRLDELAERLNAQSNGSRGARPTADTKRRTKAVKKPTARRAASKPARAAKRKAKKKSRR